ncbi:hypothetical protein VTO42DRAFT_3827 [Malbranchea cinnamomea]
MSNRQYTRYYWKAGVRTTEPPVATDPASLLASGPASTAAASRPADPASDDAADLCSPSISPSVHPGNMPGFMGSKLTAAREPAEQPLQHPSPVYTGKDNNSIIAEKATKHNNDGEAKPEERVAMALDPLTEKVHDANIETKTLVGDINEPAEKCIYPNDEANDKVEQIEQASSTITNPAKKKNKKKKKGKKLTVPAEKTDNQPVDAKELGEQISLLSGLINELAIEAIGHAGKADNLEEKVEMASLAEKFCELMDDMCDLSDKAKELTQDPNDISKQFNDLLEKARNVSREASKSDSQHNKSTPGEGEIAQLNTNPWGVQVESDKTIRIKYKGVVAPQNPRVNNGEGLEFEFPDKVPADLCFRAMGVPAKMNCPVTGKFVAQVVTRHSKRLLALRRWKCQFCSARARGLCHCPIPFFNPTFNTGPDAQPHIWDFAVPICSSVGECNDKAEDLIASIARSRYRGRVHFCPSCQKCGEPNRLLECGRCGIAKYCSKECQVADWSSHKYSCNKAAKKDGEKKTV